jgi:hypothetical protein
VNRYNKTRRNAREKNEKESKTRKSVRKKINISITDEAVGDISKKSASKVVFPKREIR